MAKLKHYNLYNLLFILYYILLYIGPSKVIGVFPLAVYYVVFLFLFIYYIYLFRNKLFLPFYSRIFLFVLGFYIFIYIFKVFDTAYISHYRDLIVIFSPLKYFVLITVLYAFILLCENANKFILKTNIYMMAIVGVVAIFQIFDIFNAREILVNYYGKMDIETWKNYFYWNPRATATFNLEANTFALYMSISLIMFHVFKKELEIGHLKTLFIYILGFFGLLLSGSMMGIMSYFILFCFYFIYYKKLTINRVIFLILVAMLLSTIFFEQIESILARQKVSWDSLIPNSLLFRFENAWTRAFNDFSENFLFGVGPGAIQITYPAENEYLDKFLRFGVLGGILYLIFILFLIFYPCYKMKKTQEKFLRKQFFFSASIAFSFFIAGMVGSVFKSSRLAELFWIFYSLPFINLHLQRLKFEKSG